MQSAILGTVAVAAALHALPAAAFEQDGFRSGMSLAEIFDTATARGSRPVAGKENNTVSGWFVMNEIGVNVSYCRGKLFAVNKSLSGGVDAFVSTAKDMISQYGPPVVQASSQYGKDGLLSYMQLAWTTTEGDEKTVTLTSFAGRPSVNLGSSAHALLCQ